MLSKQSTYFLALIKCESTRGKCLNWASLVAQTVKNPPTKGETWVRSLGREDPLEEGMATHSSILAWRIPWTEEPGRLQSMWSQRVRHNRATKPSTDVYVSTDKSQTCASGKVRKFEPEIPGLHWYWPPVYSFPGFQNKNLSPL